jgi:hypothetical protein
VASIPAVPETVGETETVPVEPFNLSVLVRMVKGATALTGAVNETLSSAAAMKAISADRSVLELSFPFMHVLLSQCLL